MFLGFLLQAGTVSQSLHIPEKLTLILLCWFNKDKPDTGVGILKKLQKFTKKRHGLESGASVLQKSLGPLHLTVVTQQNNLPVSASKRQIPLLTLFFKICAT